MNVTIHIDGGSRGNPGPAAIGVVLRDADTGRVVHQAGYFLGRMTNNAAEYTGLLRALELAHQYNVQNARIHSDSELLVKQITGEYRVKSQDLKPLYENAQRLLLGLSAWQIQHVPREQNKRADELANQALDAGADVVLNNGQAQHDPAEAPASPQQIPETHADAPRWQATLAGEPDQCLLDQPCPITHTFGPTTPDGVCVHAAHAIFADGPLHWPEHQQTARTCCQACGLTIHLQRLED